jgi:hypothetical protein
MDLIELASIPSVFIAGLWIVFRSIQAMENSVINQANPAQHKGNTK